MRGNWKAKRLSPNPSYRVLWTRHDLALIHVHDANDRPFLVLQHKSWGTQVVKRFEEVEDAREFIVMTYGFSLKANDPNRRRAR